MCLGFQKVLYSHVLGKEGYGYLFSFETNVDIIAYGFNKHNNACLQCREIY